MVGDKLLVAAVELEMFKSAWQRFEEKVVTSTLDDGLRKFRPLVYIESASYDGVDLKVVGLAGLRSIITNT